MSVYIEVMVAPDQTFPCAACGKLIRWPEEIRVYSTAANSLPERLEHVAHPVQPDAYPLEPR